MQKRRRQKSNAQDNQAGQQLGSRAAKSVVSEPNLEASRQRAMLASPRGSILLQMRVKAGQKDRSDIGIWMLGKTRESETARCATPQISFLGRKRRIQCIFCTCRTTGPSFF